MTNQLDTIHSLKPNGKLLSFILIFCFPYLIFHFFPFHIIASSLQKKKIIKSKITFFPYFHLDKSQAHTYEQSVEQI